MTGSGLGARARQARKLLDAGQEIDGDELMRDGLVVHDVAGLVVQYLQDLPVGLLGTQRAAFRDAVLAHAAGSSERVVALRKAFLMLPKPCQDMLAYLLAVLETVVEHAADGAATTAALAQALAPVLFHEGAAGLASMAETYADVEGALQAIIDAADEFR